MGRILKLVGSIAVVELDTSLGELIFLGDENLLGLGVETDAALAGYRRGEHRAKLLLVQYPRVAAARAARERFVREYLERTPTPRATLERLEDGTWVGVGPSDEAATEGEGAVLAIALDGTDRAVASELVGR